MTQPLEKLTAEVLDAAGAEAVRALLRLIGEDPAREGLVDTPRRVVKAMREMTVGYAQVPKDILGTVFTEECDEMVVVRGIVYHSMCEHHMLPFRGTVDVGYIPDGKVVGLSKIPRLVRCFARRLQVQERLTAQIADAMTEFLAPMGVGVVVRGWHSCCEIRGVGSRNEMVTSRLTGRLKDAAPRAEFLALANSPIAG